MHKLRDDVERWLVHMGSSFKEVKSDNSFQITLLHAETMIEIFEPKNQQGVLVIGSKVIMKNKQDARYITFNEDEKKIFEDKVASFCHSIGAINRNATEDGKYKIGVYMVLDDPTMINQQEFFSTIDKVVEMHEKTAEFLLKTF